ncbi:MAG: helix-turn-helix domain-containing protein [Candidatus Taylorbacteria bacterium]
MDNPLISGLANVGLNEKQAQVYLSLLKLGKGSAYVISEQSGLKKPTTYVILNELIEKGAAQLIPKVAKRLYKPVPPETLIRDAENRMNDAKQLLPSLKSIVTTKPEKINVLHYEGLKAFKEALYYRIDECIGKEIVGFYAQAGDMSPKLLAICEEYNAFCAKNNIVNKTFVPDHPSLVNFRKTDALFKRITHVLPYEIYSSSVSIDTFSDIVRIVLNKNNQMVVIENKELAKTIREIFNMMWADTKTKSDITKARG